MRWRAALPLPVRLWQGAPERPDHAPPEEPAISSRVSRNEAQARRAEASAALQAATGIDEAMIVRLVDRFYEKVREDALLGPVFAARISDWGPHLEQMYAFWSSVMLHSGRYHGRPMPKHVALPVGRRHFQRWLQLFGQTAGEVCPPEAARAFTDRAEAIAASLFAGVEAHQIATR